MTNNEIEISDALGEPIDLYQFSYGAGSATRLLYCDSDFEITVGAEVYYPGYIDRDAINTSGSLDKSELEVTVAEDSHIAEWFLVYPPSEVVGLVISRCHYDDSTGEATTPQVMWSGRVLACSREGYNAKLRCEPVATSMRRVGLRRHYQYMCPHVLYGTDCRASRVANTTGNTARAVGPRTVKVDGNVGDQYRGGMLSWTPVGKPVERRTVLNVSYDDTSNQTLLTVAGNPTTLNPGDSVELAKGCRHTLDDCHGVFDNAVNFGGMPYIPTQNPHGTTSIYT